MRTMARNNVYVIRNSYYSILNFGIFYLRIPDFPFTQLEIITRLFLYVYFISVFSIIHRWINTVSKKTVTERNFHFTTGISSFSGNKFARLHWSIVARYVYLFTCAPILYTLVPRSRNHLYTNQSFLACVKRIA